MIKSTQTVIVKQQRLLRIVSAVGEFLSPRADAIRRKCRYWWNSADLVRESNEVVE